VYLLAILRFLSVAILVATDNHNIRQSENLQARKGARKKTPLRILLVARKADWGGRVYDDDLNPNDNSGCRLSDEHEKPVG
jgi:hypothetical protein